MRRIPMPVPVADIYEAVSALELKYGRKFTPDGHLVGSIGEVIAKEAFDLELYPMPHSGHDARDRQGRDVQIKLTSRNCVALYANCDRLIVMRIVSSEEAEVIYDGDGDPVWAAARRPQKNGQRQVSISTLRKLSQVSLGKSNNLPGSGSDTSDARMRLMERDVALHRFGSFEDLKAESFRYWRRQPEHARLAAVTELNSDMWALKGARGDAPRLQRTIRLLKR